MKKYILTIFMLVSTVIVMFFLKEPGLVKAASSPATIVQNRVASSFSEEDDYCFYLQNRMNCYGYAIQVYSLSLELEPDNIGSYCYKQQPGEFANDGLSYLDWKRNYLQILYYGDAADYFDFIEAGMYADFTRLSSYSGNEWTIQTTTANAIVPSGYRKIALTTFWGEGAERFYSDFHFYMRHSDGTWSHKPGSSPVTNKSFDTNVVITDSNISSVIHEGLYDGPVQYYLIKKSAVLDYPHQYGHYDNSLTTLPSFKDMAGDSLEKSANLNTDYLLGKIDYPIDIDCFKFTSTSSGTYYFSASGNLASSDFDMKIYNSQGTLIASDLSVGDPFVTTTLQANTVYYIKLYDAEEIDTDYVLEYIH